MQCVSQFCSSIKVIYSVCISENCEVSIYLSTKVIYSVCISILFYQGHIFNVYQ